MAPEYARHGKLSMKLDVFSFGVMVLEIVSGQKNGGFRNGENVEHLLSFAWKSWKKGTTYNIIDPTLNNALREEIVRCIHIGLLCVQEKVADRPTMASVVLMLDSHSFALPVPLQPAYFMYNRCLSDIQLSGCSSVETGSNEQKNDSADASANEASISSLHPPSAERDDEQYAICYTGNDYAPNSTYQSNLNATLSRLTSNTHIDYGFYNSSYGQDSDRVYATGLCRGDLTPHTCRTCLDNSSFFLLKHCPHHKEAVGVGGYDKCMVHYADYSIFGYQESDLRFYFWRETNVTDWDQYSYVLNKLLSTLRVKAATTDSSLNRKYAAGNATGPSSETVYAVVQCSPDLTLAECNDCLNGAFSEIPKYCTNRSGGAVIKLSCNIRYDNLSFYQPTSDTLTLQLPPQGSPSHPPTPASSTTANYSQTTYHGNSNRSQADIAKYIVPIVVFVGLMIFIGIYLRVRKPTKHFGSEAKVDDEITQAQSSQFDFDTIRIATNNFSDANKLGQGGFGPVYKGTLFNEQEVAVKRLSSNSGQGDIEFKNEVLLMSRLQHRNLVRLLGFCSEREERILVYEFLPNKSLNNFIFDPVESAHLDWKKRYKIIEGIARGLLYLHQDSQQRIVHRDLKLSNILLDANMNPKISDFGLARLIVVDQTQFNASKIAGT
ncbi:Cysteine-rich receptor-like protein kinase 14, partial [Mucuna pruriens]